MKLTVFIRVYGLPILLAVVLLIGLNIGLTPFRIFAKTVVVFSAIMIAVLTDKRYIQNFTISNNHMVITYVTHFLQTKTDEIDLSSISEVNLSKRRSIALVWPPDLFVKMNGDARDYTILSKDLYNEIQTYLATSNIRLA